MNKLYIIGNLTRDPELRVTTNGVNVCSFFVAVNGKKKDDPKDPAQFFRVTAWRNLAELCQKYLAKGRTTRCNMDITADEVEFLSGRGDERAPEQGAPEQIPEEPERAPEQVSYQDVSSEMADELPF